MKLLYCRSGVGVIGVLLLLANESYFTCIFSVLIFLPFVVILIPVLLRIRIYGKKFNLTFLLRNPNIRQYQRELWYRNKLRIHIIWYRDDYQIFQDRIIYNVLFFYFFLRCRILSFILDLIKFTRSRPDPTHNSESVVFFRGNFLRIPENFSVFRFILLRRLLLKLPFLRSNSFKNTLFRGIFENYEGYFWNVLVVYLIHLERMSGIFKRWK